MPQHDVLSSRSPGDCRDNGIVDYAIDGDGDSIADDEPPERGLLVGGRRMTADSQWSDDTCGRPRRFSTSSLQSWIRSKLPFSTQDRWSSLKHSGPTTGPLLTVKTILLHSRLNLLLVFVPLGILAQFAHVIPIAIFGLNALAIIPLTGLLTYATENVAQSLGVGLGALLNITFGNLVELIVLVFLLQEGHLRLVLASLLGSLFVNLLFILGVAVVAGGLRNQEQLYNQRLTQILVYFMNMGVISLLIPTSLHACIRKSQLADSVTLDFSRGIALTLLVVYGLYLHFMLKSRYSMSDDPETPSNPEYGEAQHALGGAVRPTLARTRSLTPSIEMRRIQLDPPRGRRHQKTESESSFVAAARIPLPPEETDDEPTISRKASVILLFASAGVVSFCAEFLVESIEHVVANARLTEAFLGLIILPLLGNTAELATAVTVAVKNKMDLAINVTIGSAIQITLFMAPTMIALGWSMGENLSMHFNIFQIIALLATVAMVNGMLLNGRTHYLFGMMMCCCYVIIAIGAYVFPNQNRQSE